MFSYAPLAATLHRKQMSRTDLQRTLKASSATFAKIGRDEYVSMKILDDICNELNCEITDVITHVKKRDE